MKKLFFFRSSSSDNGNNNNGCLPSTDKQDYWDGWEGGLNNQSGDKADNNFQSSKSLFSKSRKQVYDNPASSSTSSHLRRSHSMSSAAFLVDGLEQRDFSYMGDQSRSPSTSISSAARHHDHPSSCGDMNIVQIEDAVDVELQRRSKEAEERVLLLSEELDRECFLQGSGSFELRISERDTSREELRLAKAELESQTQRLQKEKSELQSALEKELDRRSSNWSLKLEKYQLEEQRLRARVRELAEQNVSLQREVSSFSEREEKSRSVITYSEQQLRHLTQGCKRNFEEKDKECKELQKSTARLLRTCNEQEKTVEGLQEAFSQEIEKKQLLDKYDKHVTKLQMEQMRLTGVELALRREVESHRIEH
ncbi:hypothetical protein GH714_009499 [Hevea brasiliensis]|uniref:Uncharacterized protein n=1 Tax=Hevea brasiliensis TaxID=3981 RepID=A0A6A6N3B1_HEVBR|nr:hypothetical protein GH714_009499 [Hevea brasiliensis]